MTRKKGSKNKVGRPPKSAKRKGKKVVPEADKPTGSHAVNFLYDLIIKKGGLQSIEKNMHASVFNAFQLIENDLNRLGELEKNAPKEEKKDDK